jgi:hypothetical protein
VHKSCNQNVIYRKLCGEHQYYQECPNSATATSCLHSYCLWVLSYHGYRVVTSWYGEVCLVVVLLSVQGRHSQNVIKPNDTVLSVDTKRISMYVQCDTEAPLDIWRWPQPAVDPGHTTSFCSQLLTLNEILLLSILFVFIFIFHWLLFVCLTLIFF